MTCQHCQTWILDDDHRCRRCGRRVRATPSRVSPKTFPIAAAATAPAYDYEPAPEPRTRVLENGQQALFTSPAPDSRVIPFDSLTTQAERESIRARAAELARPAPVKSARVEVRHARPRNTSSLHQRTLDFHGESTVLTPADSNIICDAPVAPLSLRAKAALIDMIVVLSGLVAASGLFLFKVGEISHDKHVLPFLCLAVLAVPALYKLVWTLAGRDSFGMQCVGLRLIDFDGNPPSQERRYQRLAGSLLSVLAAGVGLTWALVDQDRLTWHDHISSTFPTLDLSE
jgi:uncharacterized RDD family membrane protein YckC